MSSMKATLLAFFALLMGLRADEDHVVTILHTNDLHGHIRPWRGWEGELAGKTVGGSTASRRSCSKCARRGRTSSCSMLATRWVTR